MSSIFNIIIRPLTFNLCRLISPEWLNRNIFITHTHINTIYRCKYYKIYGIHFDSVKIFVILRLPGHRWRQSNSIYISSYQKIMEFSNYLLNLVIKCNREIYVIIYIFGPSKYKYFYTFSSNKSFLSLYCKNIAYIQNFQV